ncbi:MAG: hypothetical protein HYY10_02835 [Candidatus Liptonbacteria bacterium]|nr:hypothetical protein [Candidatus Liptonbacteria bacterium]
MRIAAILALVLVIAVIGFEIRRFFVEGNIAQQSLKGIEAKFDKAKSESAALEANLKYFTQPENLEKEMRARFNYRSAGEKLLILVPKEPTSTEDFVPGVSP